MANYLTLANELALARTSLNANYRDINNLLTSLKSIYSGNSAIKICTDIEICLNNLKKQMDYIDSLVNILKLINLHKVNVRTLNEYKKQQANWTPDYVTTEHDLNLNQRNPYDSKVRAQADKVKEIEGRINSSLITVGPLTWAIAELWVPNDGAYKNYANSATLALESVSPLDISAAMPYQIMLDKVQSEYKEAFANPEKYFDKIGVTLASIGITPEMLDSEINANIAGATPRQAAVITGLTLLETEVSNRAISQYELSGENFGHEDRPYGTENLVNHGVDCASLVSYILNKSSDKTFNNSKVTNIPKLAGGENLGYNYDAMQVGDIFASGNHVGMYMGKFTENDKTYYFMLDASRSSVDGPGKIEFPSGIRLQYVEAKYLKKNELEGVSLAKYYDEV